MLDGRSGGWSRVYAQTSYSRPSPVGQFSDPEPRDLPGPEARDSIAAVPSLGILPSPGPGLWPGTGPGPGLGGWQCTRIVRLWVLSRLHRDAARAHTAIVGYVV